jgi:hypothetical protein
MATHRGHGGTVTITNTDEELGVSKWTMKKSRVLANKTNSKSGGHKQRQGTVHDTSWTIELPWDDDTDLEGLGVVEGEEVKLVLMRGESGYGWQLNKAIIESVEDSNDEDEDVVRQVITGFSNEKPVRITP